MEVCGGSAFFIMITAKETTDLMWAEHLYKQNEARQIKQEKLYAYYNGDSDDLERYLSSALTITYLATDIVDMQFQYINILKKLVNQIAVIYKKQPTRYLAKADGNKDDAATEYFLSIMPDDIAIKDKTAQRYAKLFGTSPTQVYYDKVKKKIQFRVHPSWKVSVKVDDENEHQVIDLRYDKYYDDELYTVIWTPTQHFKVDQDGNPSYIKGNEKGINPFGLIPFAWFISEQSEDLWGEGMTDATNVNEQINFLLTKLINRDIIIGSEGTIVAVNCGFKNKKGEQRFPRIGLKHPVTMDDIKSDDVTPTISHTSFEPLISDIKDTIDWYIKLLALTKGLNPNSFLADVQATSGYSKIVDSLEQIEFREDDIEAARLYEQERFNIIRTVNNYYAGTKEGNGLKKIDEKLTLVVDFADIEVPKTPQEIREDRQFELDNNLSTPAQWLMQDNTDLDLEAAKKKIEENKVYNDSLKKQKSLLDSLINKNNGVQKNVTVQ